MPYRLRDRERYTGQMGLITRLDLVTPDPVVYSIVGAGTRQSTFENEYTVERYPAGYDYGSTFASDLKFAIRNEPLDLAILKLTFEACDPFELEAWIRTEPAGQFSRRAWFLYELLTQKRLNLSDARRSIKNVPVLDPGKHVTIRGRPSRRHRVTDNLLGTPRLCPSIRRTRKLDELIATSLNEEVRTLISSCDPAILARAVSYLYTKETKSSYAIEGEQVSMSRAERSSTHCGRLKASILQIGAPM